jgi:hypothetical protein
VFDCLLPLLGGGNKLPLFLKNLLSCIQWQSTEFERSHCPVFPFELGNFSRLLSRRDDDATGMPGFPNAPQQLAIAFTPFPIAARILSITQDGFGIIEDD